MRERLVQAKTMFEEEQADKKDLSYDLTRQYKTLQLHSETKIQSLEATVKRLTGELQMTQDQLKIVTVERDKLKEEKEVEVAALNNQLAFLKKSYETIIQVRRQYSNYYLCYNYCIGRIREFIDTTGRK